MQQARMKHTRHAASGPTSAVSGMNCTAKQSVPSHSGSDGKNATVRALRATVWALLVMSLSVPCMAVWAQANRPTVPSDSDPDMRDGLGSATRALLSLQVSGAAAGPQQPMTGDATSAAYKRYTDSFTHPVPEFFQQRVRSDSSGGS